ncbi:MAG: dipeptidase [Parasphingorhabdus sp.]|nr:dipeptidase [Parasphingorhabdus sp.]
MKIALSLLAVIMFAGSPAVARTPEQIAAAALNAAPVFDGHNDVPEQLRERRGNRIDGFDFADTSGTATAQSKVMHTDLTRLRKGRVGAQFWSVWVDSALPEPQAVVQVLEQIDVTKRLIARYPKDMTLVTSASEVEAAMNAGRIASLIGMEGGHSIGSSLGILRQMHALGARYMTLTHFNNTPWADAATDAPAHDGLTDFGRDIVREMNRLGMLVDLSHVSEATMNDALDVAKAPVIFSHSGARSLNGHARNVPDTVLDRLKANGGIVMVTFVPDYVSEDVRNWEAAKSAEEARAKSLHIGNPEAAAGALAEWVAANPRALATTSQVADMVDHIRARIGTDHIGVGGDFDGISTVVAGLEDVSTYPALFTELARRGYTQAELMKISNANMLRVMRAAEAYAKAQAGVPPSEAMQIAGKEN